MPIFTVQPLLSPSIIEGESFKMKRNFNNQNISKLRKTVRKHITTYLKIMKLSFSECCPIERIKINDRNQHDWISNDFKNEIMERQKLYKLSVQHPRDANGNAYKRRRNEVISHQRKSDREYYKRKHVLFSNGRNYKKVWGTTRFLIRGATKNHIVRRSYHGRRETKRSKYRHSDTTVQR